jgi:hypothetical protein
MKDKLTITFVSAADWFAPKVWIDFFTSLKETLSVSPRKYCLSESKWFPFVSIDTMATDITALNSCDEENKECFSWTIRFNGQSFANLDLWKRTARMYSMCTLSFTGNWATKEHQRASLSIFFERAVWNLSAFYGSMDCSTIVLGESSPGRAFYNFRYEFPTFNWMTFFSNAVISFFGKDKFKNLSCEMLDQPTGMILIFGENPDDADLHRNRKFAAEQILGMNSFVTPAAFPSIDSHSEHWRQNMWRLDPLWHLPRMIGGGRKPKYTYVPTYETLAGEFQSSD